MAVKDILKNINLFVDGKGYAGQISEYNPPDLTVKTEDYRAGGMDAPLAVDMGMEALEASFALYNYDADILKNFGFVEAESVGLTAKAALEDYQNNVKPVTHNMRGKITNIARGTWQAGELPTLTVTVRLDYYKEDIDGQTVTEIDVQNMKRIINGKDRLESIRNAIGI